MILVFITLSLSLFFVTSHCEHNMVLCAIPPDKHNYHQHAEQQNESARSESTIITIIVQFWKAVNL